VKGLMKHKERIITGIAIVGFILGGVHFMFQSLEKKLEAHERRNNQEFEKIDKNLQTLQDKVSEIKPRKDLEEIAYRQAIEAIEFYMNAKNNN